MPYRLRSDVRAVRLGGRTAGVERGGITLALPEVVADAILQGNQCFFDGALGEQLRSCGFIEHREHPDDLSVIDRNRVFADAICEGDADGALAHLREHQFVIVGCGGLGSSVAISLASLGARRLLITDNDRIEASNLNRLLWATPADVGQRKCLALVQHLANTFGVRAEPVLDAASYELARRIHANRRSQPSTWILTVDEPAAARAVARYLHRQPGVDYVHAGYVGTKCVAGPYCAAGSDACPFCASSPYRVSDGQFVAPSAAPNNLLIAAMLCAQLVRVAGRGPDETVLRENRWIMDLVTGHTTLVPLTKSMTCAVCQP